MTYITHITRHITHIKVAVVLIVFISFFIATSVFAAELSVESVSREIKTDEQFEVKIFLNTEGERINAITGNIVFPENLLELKEIRDGGSIINFWIDPVRNCVSNGVERPNSICFSGITPGGYKGGRGLIFSMIFEAKNEGTGIIDINDSSALLNDGEGTEALLSVSSFQFLISALSSRDSPLRVDIPEDTDLPEPFELEIAQTPELFNGKYFLVFATQDKISGIDRYEVREGRGNFIATESPYLLQNQRLDEKIIVRAIDKSGNERIATLSAQNPKPLYKNYLLIAVIIIIGLAVVLVTKRKLWRKYIK